MNKSNLLPSRIKIQYFAASGLVALLLSGGACYELPNTITSAGISASDLVPDYRLEEWIDSCQMVFNKPSFNLKSGRNKQVDLIPPAKFTFKGKPLIKAKPKTEKDKTDDNVFILPCENGDAEFVVTDDIGGERRDKLNLRKIKLQLPQTPIDRSQDLKIPIDGNIYERMEIETTIAGSSIGDGDGYNDMLMNTQEYKGDRTRIVFDPKTKILTIPTQVLKRIKSNRPKIQLKVKNSLYYQYPEKDSSAWFQYNYWTPKQTLNLK
jgi:hypothetical protein